MTPRGDTVAHEQSSECVCGPRTDVVKREDGSTGWILVHHALDGRN